MRIMEAGIRRIAKKLKIPAHDVHRKPWKATLDRINGAINALPYSAVREKKQKDWYSELYVYLSHVKDAWRNATMHPDRIYSQEEAERIFASVRDFMERLAKH